MSASSPASGLPLRDGGITVAELIDLYMAQYAGRDPTRLTRLTWWVSQIGAMRLDAVGDDHVHVALDALLSRPSRYYAGRDADGKPIHRVKSRAIAPATVNRYAASIAAVFTWAMKRRIAPKGWAHPCRTIDRAPEHNERVRFLSDDERERLLAACKASKWPRLYLLVLMALTTGARKGELLGLRWGDLDLPRAVALVAQTKNGDPRSLPLVAAVVVELERLAGAPSALVFPSARTPGQAYAVDKRFQEALKEAKVRNFRFHDLRHSCASMLAKSGASLLEIADVLGHRQMQVTKRYAHLATGHKAALVNRVLGDVR